MHFRALVVALLACSVAAQNVLELGGAIDANLAKKAESIVDSDVMDMDPVRVDVHAARPSDNVALVETGTHDCGNGGPCPEASSGDGGGMKHVMPTNKGKDCPLGCSMETTPVSQDPELENMNKEYEAITKEMKEVDAANKVAVACAAKIPEIEERIRKLKNRWSMLGDQEKRMLLRHKIETEDQALSHVRLMAETLRERVEELDIAKKDLEEKNALMSAAMKGAPALPPSPPTLPPKDAVETSLAKELAALHESMKNSVKSSNTRVLGMVKEVPGLHDLKYETQALSADKIAEMTKNDPEMQKKFDAWVKTTGEEFAKKKASDDEAKAHKQGLEKIEQLRKASRDAKEAAASGDSFAAVHEKLKKEKVEDKEIKNLRKVVSKLKRQLKK